MVVYCARYREGVTLSSLKGCAGYTLTEMIIYLALFSMLVTIIAPIIRNFVVEDPFEQVLLEREAHIFFQQLEREVHLGRDYSISGDRLTIMTEEDFISFQRLNQNVRRQLNGTGHIVMLQYVQNIEWLALDEQFFQVSIELALEDQSYSATRIIGLRR